MFSKFFRNTILGGLVVTANVGLFTTTNLPVQVQADEVDIQLSKNSRSYTSPYDLGIHEIFSTYDEYSLKVITQAKHGYVEVDGLYYFVYTPEVNFSGEDSFEYEVCGVPIDSSQVNTCNIFTATINVMNDKSDAPNNGDLDGDGVVDIFNGNLNISKGAAYDMSAANTDQIIGYFSLVYDPSEECQDCVEEVLIKTYRTGGN